MRTTTICIPEGTIVGRITGDVMADREDWFNHDSETLHKVVPVTLVGTVYVEAYRDYDGSWVYSVGKEEYCCAGGLATVFE
jgi:hypothetical protein